MIESKKQESLIRKHLYTILLIYVLLSAAFFRFRGIFWGEYQYLHPDERFLIWVGTDIQPVDSIAEYFDTANSTLNPHNQGHGFYVYGTFPMFLTRYLVEWVFGHSGFNEMTQVGRVLSALADLFTVCLVYLIAKKMFDERVGILAAAFSAAVALQIQQAHFFTMDTFMNAFMALAFYYAVRVVKNNSPSNETADSSPNTFRSIISAWLRDPLFAISLGFGAALGAAVASKIDAAPMAITLPAAFLLYILKQPHDKREAKILPAVFYLLFAAFVSLIVFRLLQPYAFKGPGFFNLLPNPQWVANIRELLAQSGGNVDFPPAMQWARRPRWFSLQNMVLWGFGLPLGLLAWFGFFWMAKTILGDKTNRIENIWRYGLLWGWTAVYFLWQSTRLNATMRYQLPIYPTLTIMAAWVVFHFYDRFRAKGQSAFSKKRFYAWVAILTGGMVLSLTIAYALAFSGIYTHPITRVAASRWIYENIPGAINLKIQTEAGVYNQPIPYTYSFILTPGVTYKREFTPQASGMLESIHFAHIIDKKDSANSDTLEVLLRLHDEPIAHGSLSGDFPANAIPGEAGYDVFFEQPIQLEENNRYTLEIAIPGESVSLVTDGKISLEIQPLDSSQESQNEVYPLQLAATLISPGSPLTFSFQSPIDGFLTHIQSSLLTPEEGDLEDITLGLSFKVQSERGELSDIEITPIPDDLGGMRLELSQPVALVADENYQFSLSLEAEGSMLTLQGAALANEGEWDDGLPLRMDGYDGFGGIYPNGLNFNMYWDDNQEKVERFVRILDQAEYIAISSSRQWGSLPRIPERFPMTTLYYRNLLGCPPDEVIERCYNLAKPGMYEGNFGFDLVEVFQSDPALGSLRINDQFAEEAFTVYDHPKVFIFKKNSSFDTARIREILGNIDFSKIIRKPPMQYAPHPEDLLLPDYRFAEQMQGGTWSELFNTQAIHNRHPVLAAILWYMTLFALGLVTYPLLRRILPGLADKGYPLARISGLLVLSYLVWLAGSARIPFSRTTITLAASMLGALGVYLAVKQRKELSEEWKTKWKYFLWVEGLFLIFFTVFLLIRLGNPDLWHPWKGGEKPMDFSYFNAVLKSTSFPPYDPWYAGGYLNYYYYGFVLVGVLVKWLGIVPSVAYNLILPTIFSIIALGAFSITWNLTSKITSNRANSLPSAPLLSSIAASLGMAVLGNLGTVKMFYQGFARIVAPGGTLEGSTALTRLIWSLRGFVDWIGGAKLPYGIGDWYWIPSRAIPAPGDVEPITEFPFFTALYGDPHAHLLALPLTILALAVPISIILSRGKWASRFWAVCGILFAGLAAGSLRPTNTWDFPPYLAIGAIFVGYGLWLREDNSSPESNFQRILISLAGMGFFVLSSFVLFQPYAHWYALGYTEVALWKGTHTPLSAYFTHWGLFLFVIISWMASETIQWLAETPVSALHKLRPLRGLIQSGLAILLIAIVATLALGVKIAWFVLPMAAWAGVLILRPGQSSEKRIVLLMIGTGLTLTLMVEVIVLRGDIGRMNTVFKFYLQVWTLFAISAASALGWLIRAMRKWSDTRKIIWQLALIALVTGAAMYPLMATTAKIKDRMAKEAPHTLDGMAFMEYATYADSWGPMDLSQDYHAILWMLENVEGSPVIVEANLRDLYRWGSRYSIYTGLPGVVGWEWHQQQQRTVVPASWVSERIAEVDDFYLTTDWESARKFLQKYNVRYIILGQQERGHYPGAGLDKFNQAEGILWRKVYQYEDTIIYEVISS